MRRSFTYKLITILILVQYDSIELLLFCKKFIERYVLNFSNFCYFQILFRLSLILILYGNLEYRSLGHIAIPTCFQTTQYLEILSLHLTNLSLIENKITYSYFRNVAI